MKNLENYHRERYSFLGNGAEEVDIYKYLKNKYNVDKNDIIGNGEINSAKKEVMMNYLKVTEKGLIRDFYSETTLGRIIFLNELGYKSSSDKTTSDVWKIVKIALKSGTSVGTVALLAAVLGPAGTLAAIAYTIAGTTAALGTGIAGTAIGNKLSNTYDSINPQLGKRVLSLNEVKKEGASFLISLAAAGADEVVDLIADNSEVISNYIGANVGNVVDIDALQTALEPVSEALKPVLDNIDKAWDSKRFTWWNCK